MTRAVTILPLALLLSLAPTAAARAEDLALGEDCAAGFQRFMQMAERGELGADVHAANVSVEKTAARIELVRNDAPSKRLLLTPRRNPTSAARYFDVTSEAGATAADVSLVGAALNRAFSVDPFIITGTESIAADAPSAILAAWWSGGWRAALRSAQRRMMSTVSISYTVAVIAALALCTATSLLLLWSPAPRASEAEEGSAGGTVSW